MRHEIACSRRRCAGQCRAPTRRHSVHEVKHMLRQSGSSSRTWLDRDAMRRTFARAVVLRSLTVAVLIGTILNAINQGAELLAGQHVSVLKMLLTYAVPFCVASYGADAAFRQRADDPD